MTTKRARRGAFRQAILKYIRRNPGANSTHISEYLSCPVTNVTGTLLTKEGKLTRRWKSGPVGERGYVYWVVEEQPEAVADTPETVTIADLPTAPDRDELYARINAQQAEIDDLHADVVELEAWKAEAIAQHPDLAPPPPMDPLLPKARTLGACIAVLNGSSTQDATLLRDGGDDNRSEVQLALAMLRKMQEA